MYDRCDKNVDKNVSLESSIQPFVAILCNLLVNPAYIYSIN